MAIGRTKTECEQLDQAQLADHLGGLPLTKEYCAVLAVLALRNALAKLASSSLEEEKAA
jgi:hypothetical protein